VIAWLRSARGLAILLVLSVAVNLFLGGMLAGRITGQAARESPIRQNIREMLAPLPEEKRALVQKEIRAEMPRVREQFTALQAARAALAEEMVKPVPDNAALERGFAEVQARTAAIGTTLQRAIQRALPSLSQEERRAMVAALARHTKR